MPTELSNGSASLWRYAAHMSRLPQQWLFCSLMKGLNFWRRSVGGFVPSRLDLLPILRPSSSEPGVSSYLSGSEYQVGRASYSWLRSSAVLQSVQSMSASSSAPMVRFNLPFERTACGVCSQTVGASATRRKRPYPDSPKWGIFGTWKSLQSRLRATSRDNSRSVYSRAAGISFKFYGIHCIGQAMHLRKDK